MYIMQGVMGLINGDTGGKERFGREGKKKKKRKKQREREGKKGKGKTYLLPCNWNSWICSIEELHEPIKVWTPLDHAFDNDSFSLRSKKKRAYRQLHMVSIMVALGISLHTPFAGRLVGNWGGGNVWGIVKSEQMCFLAWITRSS
jgi:hypothetical protein